MPENPSKGRVSLGLLVEGWGPLGLSIICVGALYYWRDPVLVHFTRDGWSMENLYTAIFDWSAIQTGFLFAVYGFVVGKSDGFVKEIKRTVHMRRYMSYTTRATIIGFLLTFVSLGLIVVSPNPTTTESKTFLFLLVWFGLFVWAFLSFLRVAYIFGIIVRIKDKGVIPG